MRTLPLICLVASIFCANQALAQSNPDKLVAYFPFKTQKIFDESGNNSTGAILGDTAWSCGVQDNAFRFKTNGGLLLVGPVSDVFSTSDFTVQFYIRPDIAAKGPKVIMSKQENCDTKNAFFIKYNKSNNGNINTVSASISENDNLIALVQAKLDERCWHHVAVVRNNTKFQLFVNGVLRDTKNSNGRINLTSNAPLELAEPVCPQDEGFIGDIDELRFHSKALGADDIKKYFGRPDQILNSDTVVFLGNSVKIKTATNAACLVSTKWIPGKAAGVSNDTIAEPVITPTLPTAYIVEFRQNSFCTARDTIFIDVIDPDTLDCNKIFIPSAFTPGDTRGLNDVFGISNPFTVRDFISFEVFDRWGGRMFSAVDASETWDGTFNGKPVNPGNFLYRLRYRCRGEEKVKTGNLTLLR